MKEEIRLLPVKLTEEEIDGLRRDHIDTCDRLAELEAEAKESAADFRKRIKGIREEERKQRKAVQTGQTDRATRCEERLDLDAGVARWIRTDTGEQVGDTRTLTPEELKKERAEAAKARQAQLFALPGGKPEEQKPDPEPVN
jgi:hypothetical protein